MIIYKKLYISEVKKALFSKKMTKIYPPGGQKWVLGIFPKQRKGGLDTKLANIGHKKMPSIFGTK